MPAWFTVGALAIAARRANAVGAVRLTCAPHGLEIELVRAFGFTAGFAPGSVAEAVRFTVPYVAVRGLVRRGRMLYLTLDPAVATPHTRFALARFTEDPAEVLARAYRARLYARWASYLVPAPLGALAAVLVSGTLVSGWLGRASLGLVVASVLTVALRELVAWRTWGGPLSDRYRDALEAELSRKLGLLPARIVEAGPFDDAIVEPREPSFRLLSALLSVSIAAATVVGAMAFLQRYAGEKTPPPRVPVARTGHAARVAQRSAAEQESASRQERCACVRADSPLWSGGIPALAVLLFSGDDSSAEVHSSPGRGGAPRYDFDLAVVNNTARAQRDVRVTVTFARRSKTGRRIGAVDRGLFWAGALEPGRSVKWRLSAPGTELRIDTSVSGTLDDAELAPANAEAFFALTTSRYRAVRLHAAKMLAYLRDPRAADAALSLGSHSADEQLTIARIVRAAAPLTACDVTHSEAHAEACIFNGSSRAASGVELREVAPLAVDPSDAPKAAGPALRRFRIGGVVPIHEGVRVRVPFEGDLPEEWAVESAPEP